MGRQIRLDQGAWCTSASSSTIYRLYHSNGKFISGCAIKVFAVFGESESYETKEMFFDIEKAKEKTQN